MGSVCGTDPKYTSRVTQRGGFTAIDAYYQIHSGDQLWGPYGSAWGLRNMVRTLNTEMEMAFLDAEFHYPDGDKDACFQIANSIDIKSRSKSGAKWDDEFVKKLETNTISKALSARIRRGCLYGNVRRGISPSKIRSSAMRYRLRRRTRRHRRTSIKCFPAWLRRCNKRLRDPPERFHRRHQRQKDNT